MTTVTLHKPVGTDHNPAIDCLRGFALLGILLINVQTYSLFAFLRIPQVYELGLDSPTQYAPLRFFIHALVKGQFYTIYSFLFGLGFYRMWNRYKQAGLAVNRLASRRLLVLLLLGLIHAFFIWFGDILHQYALLGFTLLYFIDQSVSALLKWIAGLLVVGVVIQLIATLGFPGTVAEMARSQQQYDSVIRQMVHTWQHGSMKEVINLQKAGVVMLHGMAFGQGLAPYIHDEIMFLLGLIVGKLQLFDQPAAVKRQFLRNAFWIFPLGLLLKGIASQSVMEVHVLPASKIAYEPLLFSLADFLGAPLLTLVYLVELSVFFSRKPNRLTYWIGHVGRLGLTNYLVQTLLCMTLFYGYGLGLAGRLTLLESLLVAIGLYVFQVGYSTLWLMYYEQGPLEWLWQKLAYGKRLAIATPGAPAQH